MSNASPPPCRGERGPRPPRAALLLPPGPLGALVGPVESVGRAGPLRHRFSAAPFARPRSAAAPALLEERHEKNALGRKMRGEERRGLCLQTASLLRKDMNSRSCSQG